MARLRQRDPADRVKTLRTRAADSPELVGSTLIPLLHDILDIVSAYHSAFYAFRTGLESDPDETLIPRLIHVRSDFPELTEYLSADDPVVQRHAAAAFADLAGHYPDAVVETVPELIDLLSDAEPDVAVAAARSLARIGDETDYDFEDHSIELAAVLTEPHPEIRRHVWQLFAAMSPSARLDPRAEIIDAAITAISDHSTLERRLALETLATHGTPRDQRAEARVAVRERLSAPAADVRTAAVRTLPKLYTPPIDHDLLVTLEDRLTDEDETVRAVAAEAIGSFASEDAASMTPLVPQLVEQLDANTPRERGEAMHALAQFADTIPARIHHTVPDVVDALGADDTQLQLMALATLYVYADAFPDQITDAAPRVTELMHGHPAVRPWATMVTGEIGVIRADLAEPLASELTTVIEEFEDRQQTRLAAGRQLANIARHHPTAVAEVAPRLLPISSHLKSVQPYLVEAFAHVGIREPERFEPHLPTVLKEIPRVETSVWGTISVYVSEIDLHFEQPNPDHWYARLVRAIVDDYPTLALPALPTFIEALESSSRRAVVLPGKKGLETTFDHIETLQSQAETVTLLADAYPHAVNGYVDRIDALIWDENKLQDVRGELLRTLGHLGNPNVERTVEAKLLHHDDRIRGGAAYAATVLDPLPETEFDSQ